MYLDIPKGCRFGGCKNYNKCSREYKKTDDYTNCESFRECFTYMDKYGNDMEYWAEMHGEDYE